MKIEVSVGEVVDKATILEIKLEKVSDKGKLSNIKKEYDLLIKDLNDAGISSSLPGYIQLREINLKLWDIEDKIRVKESLKQFDDEFIELARSVYFTNDDRATIKKDINLEFDSNLVEEKEYVDYKKKT